MRKPKSYEAAYEADDAAWDTKVAPTSLSVLVSDDLEETGLLDAKGNKLYRCRQSAGFIKW